jgi:hypothetical protein
MKRTSFLKLCLVGGSTITSPFITLAKTGNKKRVDKGFKVDSGKDRFDKSISLFEGDTFFVKFLRRTRTATFMLLNRAE